MGRGGQIAFAVATGYALGRGRRMRWALALAAAAAVGRLTAGRGGLAGGLGRLGASPGLGRLLDAGRPLVSAGGAAARTAMGGRIDAAADRLQQTAQRLRGQGRTDDGDPARTGEPGAGDADTDERYRDEPDDRPRYRGRSRYDDGDERDDDERYDAGDDLDDLDDRGRDDEDGEDEDREDEDREDDEVRDDDPGGARRRGRAPAVESPRPAVRRRGRRPE